MGNNYRLVKLGNYIDYWPIKEEPMKPIVVDKTIEFAVSDSWLFGRTEKGWFGINKETHELFYPYLSKQDLQGKTGVAIDALSFTRDTRPYAVIQLGTLKVLRYMKIALSTILVLLVIPLITICCIRAK
jgi:hypothetical protein